MLTLDTGDLILDGSPLSTIKLQMLLMGLQLARYDALVPGEGERAYPIEELRSLAEGARIALVGHRASLTASGSRIALWQPAVGLADAALAPAAPKASSLPGGIRVAVVPMDVDAASRWAGQRSPFHVIMATRDDYATPRYRALSDTCLVTSTGVRGEYLVDLTVTLRGEVPSRVGVRYIALDDTIPPAPAGSALIAAYQARLRDERLVEETPRLPLRAGQRYAGSAACRPCHEAASTAWAGSRHARAFASLVTRERVFDPDCVACHVTGLPQESGYVSQEATGHLAHVGCESCHGPGGEHAADPARKTPGKAREACVTCHTPEHSPHYEAEGYLAKIRHR